MRKIKILLTSLSLILISFGCSDFLDEKSDLKLATPDRLEDNQMLLNNYGFLNVDFASSGETSSDDYYLTDADYNGLSFEASKRLHIWMPDNVAPPISSGNDWSTCYRSIYICNAVLFNMQDKNFTGEQADNIRGQALALRAFRYLDAAQIWCPAYNPQTAGIDLGLPLRLDPDMNIPSVRSTVKQTYDQIISDLQTAIPLLLPKQISGMRISRAAAYGLLARTYLFMGDYDNALKNSEQALSINNDLMDFNTLNPNADYPIEELNKEVLLWTAITYESHLMPAKIPDHIYQMYDSNDLRRTMFFRKNTTNEILFKGYYNNVNGPIVSVTTDELYLMAAECNVRLNKIQEGMGYLNNLLVKRWKAGTYVPIVANSQAEALNIILKERRKELLIRGLRWSDLKRYNRDGANITLTRTINGQTYTLPPNDLRYAIAIPEDIITLTGMPQNPR
ncbi:RagB/SusD family nutrient uptake outer membrane protein [Chryseobacterium carnipullorum]|uniref:SusD family n=2 Tax=Chryseobacterium TaxID=59732 RepID=A0A376E1U8_CHRCU|nr:RagB/SusD family nutrient uptake outer membrane protein [Chryseobacterium carnipullorum]AZA50547.1 RagB/SusD family nutrient uptake outer membrane protein [Chryseobacterium carnipullorum]AZA65413.1 RagB/SusD family nutrient uptake outer membrane protein [Chryseobacterium carnipullorum]STD00395.1 SusD family [Chryseobacterium carnipullorum]